MKRNKRKGMDVWGMENDNDLVTREISSNKKHLKMETN
jgi:hypothetical protein